MATIQSDGSSPVTASSTKNNNGAAKNVGTSTLLDNISLDRPDYGVFASTVIDGADTNEALSASVIAYNNQRPIAKRVSTTISGQSNDILQSGAGVPGDARSINKRESFKVSKIATAIRAGEWNIYTGEWGSPPTATTESPGDDHAATPTRTIPGEFTYKLGQPIPVNDDYKAKNG